MLKHTSHLVTACKYRPMERRYEYDPWIRLASRQIMSEIKELDTLTLKFLAETRRD